MTADLNFSGMIERISAAGGSAEINSQLNLHTLGDYDAILQIKKTEDAVLKIGVQAPGEIWLGDANSTGNIREFTGNIPVSLVVRAEQSVSGLLRGWSYHPTCLSTRSQASRTVSI